MGIKGKEKKISEPGHENMTMRKNEEFELLITDYSSEGLGLGRYAGFVWFVKDTVIGDRVKVSAMKIKRNYGYARLVAILEASRDRVDAFCPVARSCGGCQLQEVEYGAQLRFKESRVKQSLRRIAGIEESKLEEAFRSVLGMDDPMHYRNKAVYPVAERDGKPVAGFFAARTHRVIPCSECGIGAPENKHVVEAVLEWMERFQVRAYDEARHMGLIRHILIRKSFFRDCLMVCLIINGDSIPESESLWEKLKEYKTSSFSISIQKEKGNVILGKKFIHLYGEERIEERLGDIVFQISPASFFQVNTAQAGVLYQKAVELAGLTGKETVWDLYCGTGTISLFMARKAGQVYGAEIVPEAIEDARMNALRNGIQNVEFFAGSADILLEEWSSWNPDKKIDVICLDPPRKGSSQRCLDAIIKASPEKIVYISCNPESLARDISYLHEGGYELEVVQPVDLFPFTCHVETVVLLTRQNT